MGHNEYSNFSDLHPLAVLTIEGYKPAALVPFADPTVYRTHGLEVRPAGRWVQGQLVPNQRLAISKPQFFDEAFPRLEQPKLPIFQNGVCQLLMEIGDMSLAEALVMLAEYPRLDPEFSLGTNCIVYPEVAIVQGILYGYKACDIEYYIKTRYLAEPIDHEIEDVTFTAKLKDPHIYCPDCVRQGKFK